MYRYRTDRVIHMESHIHCFNREIHQNTRPDSDQECAERVYARTSCRDSNQSGQRRIEAHGDIRLSVLHPGEQHARYGRHRRSYGCRSENSCHFTDIRRCSPVKSVPGKPQDETSQCPQCHGMSRNRIGDQFSVFALCILSDPRSQNDRTHKR